MRGPAALLADQPDQPDSVVAFGAALWPTLGLPEHRDKEQRGFQDASAANITGGRTDGAQASAAFNVRDHLDCVHLSAGVNVASTSQGLQVGIVNVSPSDEDRGLKIGIVNVSHRLHGATSGLVSGAEEVDGAAVGWAASGCRSTSMSDCGF